MNNPKKVTLRDLARELGMSDRSVSQALNPRESNVKLSPATVERVQALAAQRGYRVDSRARAMRYGRFFNLGYFEASHLTVHYPLHGAEAGLVSAAAEQNFHVVLVKLPPDLSPLKNSLPLIFKQTHLDALIISHLGNLPAAYVEAITASGLPVVYLNEKRPVNSVYVDDEWGAAELTNHLLDQGRRKIAYVRPITTTTHYSSTDRQAGYEAAMRQRGLAPVFCNFPGVGEWSPPPDIEVAMCPDDLTALRLQRILYEDNIRVPDQLEITGYNNDFALDSPVPFARMHIPFYEMGRAAANMAIALLDMPGATLPSEIFRPEKVVKETVSPWMSLLHRR